MKIVILGLNKLKYMPYLNFYLENIDLDRNDLAIVNWIRDGMADISLDRRINVYSFRKQVEDSLSIFRKIFKIFAYGRFATKIIKSQSPDLIIVCYPQAALSVLPILWRKFKGKYILDYRDVTYENRVKAYGKLVKMISEKAALTYTSSDGFRSFLPNSNVYTVRNFTKREIEKWRKDSAFKKKENLPLRICFWGLIRGYQINERIIAIFGNDSRFELHYYGSAGSEMLRLLKKAISTYNNVFFHGEYLPPQREEFVASCDLLHNMYEVRGTIPFAMGNKYYDGIIFKKPQLFMVGSYMAERNKESKVGLNCDPFDTDFADKVFNYYANIDVDEFCKNCDKELDKVCQENAEASKILKEFIHNVDLW